MTDAAIELPPPNLDADQRARGEVEATTGQLEAANHSAIAGQIHNQRNQSNEAQQLVSFPYKSF